MNISVLKSRLSRFAMMLWTHSLYVLAAAAIIIFLIVQIQKYLDRREIDFQNKKVERLDEQIKQSREQTQTLIGMFYEVHNTTAALIQGITDTNQTINKLSDNDRRQAAELNNLKDEYKNARNPNSTVHIKTNTIYLAPKPNRTLRQRENDILADDAKLYPDAAKR